MKKILVPAAVVILVLVNVTLIKLKLIGTHSASH